MEHATQVRRVDTPTMPYPVFAVECSAGCDLTGALPATPEQANAYAALHAWAVSR